MSAPSLVVVGSVNLDLVARCETLPRPGETVTGAAFERIPGGKGANQAVAAARLGADVTLVCAVGRDPFVVQHTDDLIQVNVGCRPGQAIAAFGAPLRLH